MLQKWGSIAEDLPAGEPKLADLEPYWMVVSTGMWEDGGPRYLILFNGYSDLTSNAQPCWDFHWTDQLDLFDLVTAKLQARMINQQSQPDASEARVLNLADWVRWSRWNGEGPSPVRRKRSADTLDWLYSRLGAE